MTSSYPNPFHDGTLSVKVETRPPSSVRVRLFPTLDGRLRSAHNNYATARAGGAAVDQVETTDDRVYVGQNKAASSPLYRLHEGFVEFGFDGVGGVPSDATVEAVTLKATPRGLSTGGADFTIEASVFDFGTSLEAADWRSGTQLAALTRVATKATAGLAVGVGFEFDDVALVDAVQAALAGRKLRIVLASNRMRAATTPSGPEYVTLHSSEGSSIWNAMQLEVTYTPAYEHAEVELAGAPCEGLSLSNSGPGGFGGASWQLSTDDDAGPYHPLLAKGNLVTITHGDPPVVLHEGEITGDVSHPISDGGRLYYDVSSAGLWWRAGQRKDFAAVLFDDDVGQWFQSPLAAKGYTLDLDGRIFLAIEAKQATESGKSAGVFYWLLDGMGGQFAAIREFLGVVRWSTPLSGGAETNITLDYSVITPFGTGVASPWVNLRTWAVGATTTGYALRQDLTGLNAKALRLRITVPGGTDGFGVPREFEVWDPCVVCAPLREAAITAISKANPTVITTAAPHGLTTGDRVFIHGANGAPKVDGWRTVTVLSPTTFTVAVNVTTAGTAGTVCRAWRIDEAMAEVAAGGELALTTGLAVDVDAVPLGNTYWNLCARPHESRADTLNRWGTLSPEPFDYGFWDDRTFVIRPHVDPPPADRHFAVDATAAGVDVNVLREAEGVPGTIKLLYSYRAIKDATDPDSYKKSSYPDGIEAAVYRPEDMLDRAAADAAVDVWTEFSDVAMTHDEAVDLADQILAWVGSQPASGTVKLTVPYIERADGQGQMLAAYLRGGDRLTITNWPGYEKLPITGVDVDTAKATVTLDIGETREEFVTRLRNARDVAAPHRRVKRGWWKKRT